MSSPAKAPAAAKRTSLSMMEKKSVLDTKTLAEAQQLADDTTSQQIVDLVSHLQSPSHLDEAVSDLVDRMVALEVVLRTPPSISAPDALEKAKMTRGLICRLARESAVIETLASVVVGDQHNGVALLTQRCLFILANLASEEVDPEHCKMTRAKIGQTGLLDKLIRFLSGPCYEAKVHAIATLLHTSCCEPSAFLKLEERGVTARLQELAEQGKAEGDSQVESLSKRALRATNESRTIYMMTKLNVQDTFNELDRHTASAIHLVIKLHKRKREGKKKDEQQKACTCIQTRYRGKLARKKRTETRAKKAYAELRAEAVKDITNELYWTTFNRMLSEVVDDAQAATEELNSMRKLIGEEVSNPGSKHRRAAKRAAMLAKAEEELREKRRREQRMKLRGLMSGALKADSTGFVKAHEGHVKKRTVKAWMGGAFKEADEQVVIKPTRGKPQTESASITSTSGLLPRTITSKSTTLVDTSAAVDKDATTSPFNVFDPKVKLCYQAPPWIEAPAAAADQEILDGHDLHGPTILLGGRVPTPPTFSQSIATSGMLFTAKLPVRKTPLPSMTTSFSTPVISQQSKSSAAAAATAAARTKQLVLAKPATRQHETSTAVEQEEADDGGLRPKTPMEFQGLHRGTHLAKILPRRGRPAVDGSPLAPPLVGLGPPPNKPRPRFVTKKRLPLLLDRGMLEATYRVSATPSSDWLEYVG